MVPASDTQLKLIKYFNIGYILIFTLFALWRGNYEFLFYSVGIFAIVWYIHRNYHTFYFTKSTLILLSIFGFLHLFAGQFMIGDVRLYDYWLIPDMLKFDNVVHALGGGIAGFISYNFLSPHLDSTFKRSSFFIIILIATMASGFGAFNEIIEFIAVVFLDAAEAVGDYTNTAIDLVYNLIGALLVSMAFFFYTSPDR